jgi:hypothetical protein
MAGALNKRGEGQVLLHAILNARSHCVGGKGNRTNPVWVTVRQVEDRFGSSG